MSEKVKEWFQSLSEETRMSLDEEVEKIRELDGEVIGLEGEIEKRQDTLSKMVKDLATKIEDLVKDPNEISSIIKHLLEGKVSEQTIEKALPKEHKRKYNRYQGLEIPNVGISNEENTKTIEVSSTGEQQLSESEPQPQPQQQSTSNNLERSAEIALTTVEVQKKDLQDKELEINERDVLIKDKEKRIEQLLLANGELEIQIADLKKKPTSPPNTPVPAVDFETDELRRLRIENEELREVNAIHTRNQDFNIASEMKQQQQQESIQTTPWVAAEKMIFLWQAQRGCIERAKKEPKWNQAEQDSRKIFFDLDSATGEVKGCHL